MNKDEMLVLELVGETQAAALGAGVNEALADESAAVVEIMRHVAKLRGLAARAESTEESAYEMEKFGVQAYTDGDDITDGANPTYTTINAQSLVQFLDSAAEDIQFGVKLSPKLLKQARQEPARFLARYRASLAEALAQKEDVYIGSILCNSDTSDSVSALFGGSAVDVDTLQSGDVFTATLLEDMIDQFKEQSVNDPTDLVIFSRGARQLRDDARKLNDGEYRTVVKDDGTRVTMYGDIVVHEIGGSTILPYATNGSGVDYNCAVLLNKAHAFGIVDFDPVKFYVAQPDPTIDGANFHRMLVTETVECKILDPDSLVLAKVAKL
jgi:hypothetical protein